MPFVRVLARFVLNSIQGFQFELFFEKTGTPINFISGKRFYLLHIESSKTFLCIRL